MPQLMIKIWFNILAMTWAIFLFILPTKILPHTFLGGVAPQKHATSGPMVTPWNWKWQ